MDDLDHSMYIAEYDWTSFYEECEECGLLQPSLACPDNLSLSDSEDSGNSGQQEPQQSPAANSDESNAAGCSIEVQINQSASGEDDLTTKAQEDAERQVKSDTCLNYPEGNAINSTEETNDKITITLQTEQLHVQTSDGESTELRKDEKESDTSSIHEPDPLSRRQTELSVNEPQSADRAVSEDVSRRAEKERWFVTVNDSPARQRVRATSAKKKRRQKKPCRNNHMCRTPGEEKSSKNNLELNSDDNNECEGGRDTEYVTQSNQNSAEESPESMQMGVISDVLQMSLTSGKEDSLSEKLEPTIDRNKHDPSSSTFTSQDIFIAKDPPRWDSVESDEFVDGAEFFSTHSYDSESYLSATESVEEPQRPLMEKQQLQRSSVLTKDSFLFRLAENTDTDHQEGETHPTATNSESYESTDVGPTMDFPSVAQSANKMPDDTSTCDSDTHSTLLRTPSNSTGLQKHEINLSASGCSTGDQPGLPTVPGVTLTPCSAGDSPETYAEAAGNTRPVYAISAFWDEMEKLTINDILQLRMGRSIPQETVTANSDDFPANHRHTAEYNLSDGALMDTSDTADSDYFTQPDESKPDCSSCEFSTSDFEEEYWQFLGASRNATPESESKNHPGMRDSPLFAREEEESTSSEGRETPVPSGDFSRECLDSDAFISSEPAWPRWTTKSKSVHDVQALSTEDLSLQLLVGDDESSLFLSSCPSLEEKMVLKASDSQIPAPYLSNTDILLESTQISFPEVFEYFFPDDKAKRDYRCVAVYDPEDISVTPVFDYTLCTFRDESSFSSLADSHCRDEKPIPIFSCSHPTVRELTFPNPDYVFPSADCEDEDDFSPIRVVSHSFVQGDDGAASAAAPPGFHNWRSLLSIRKIRFHDKGSIWCRRSGAWVFPVETEKITIKTSDPPIKVVTDGNFSSSASSQLFRQLEVQQRILGTIQTTRREGIFSTLKQSDMCLVCIAFASWVLRSSDPKAADAWKAALLANISALSAIQYLRQYVKKRNPSQDDP